MHVHNKVCILYFSELPIKTVAIFSDGLFDGESHVV